MPLDHLDIDGAVMLAIDIHADGSVFMGASDYLFPMVKAGEFPANTDRSVLVFTALERFCAEAGALPYQGPRHLGAGQADVVARYAVSLILDRHARACAGCGWEGISDFGMPYCAVCGD